jgi:hypothetical protein
MDVKSKLSLRRVYSTDEGPITITVKNSNFLELCTIKISRDNFLDMVFGLGECEAQVELNKEGMENFSKTKIIEDLVFRIPEDVSSYNQKEWARENAQKFATNGFTASIAFNSQGSFFKDKNEQRYARTSQVKWVENEQE